MYATLGQISTNYGQFFLDEFQLYSTQLTADQVKSLYNARGGNLTAVQQGAYDQKTLSDGLVGYWKFDETSGNASDSSGNATTLTNNSTTAYTTAKFGNSGEMDGLADYFEAADNTTLSITGDLTLSAWINNDDTTGTQHILGKWDDTNNSYLLSLEGDELRMYIDSSSNYQTTTAANIGSNVFTHVAGVYSASTQSVSLYVNGILQTSTTTGTIPSSVGDDAGEIVVGASDAPSNYFDGHIDEARIYSRALSPQEIKQLYEWAPGPIGYWKLDENSGTNVYDNSTNSLNGTIGGGAQWNSGKIGASLKFDGTDDYVSISDSSVFDLTNSFTIQAWTKYTGGTFNANDMLLGRGKDNSNDFHYFFKKVNGTDIFEFYVENSSGTGVSLYSNAISANRWYHLAGTWDGTTTRFFVDGIQVDSGSLTGSFSNTSNPLTIGSGESFTNPASFPYKGFVDEVKIYNYALTPTQVKLVMNNNAAVKF